MKTIFYILSVLVIGASAYFAFENKAKLLNERAVYDEAFATNANVTASIKTTLKNLDDTKQALTASKAKHEELKATKSNEEAKERSHLASVEKYETEIEDHDAKLAEFAEIEAKVKEMMKGIDIPFARIGEEIEKLKSQQKGLQKDFEELEVTILGLEKNVSSNKDEVARLQSRLVDMRQRIARNSLQGRITAVDPVWGFVVVNLGDKNSNITAQSDLLVYRDGVFLGRLDIQSIEPNQTISDIDLKHLRPGQRIRPGDTVILAKTVGN